MVNSRVIRITALFFVSCLLIINMVGCASPISRIKFQENSKRTKEFKIQIPADSHEIYLTGRGYFGPDYTVYRLGIGIEVVCQAECENLIVYPDSIKVWFEDEPMELFETYLDTTYSDKGLLRQKYICNLKCNPEPSLHRLKNRNLLKSDFLKLFIGNTITYKSQALIIDTIFATDNTCKDFPISHYRP